MKKFNILQNLKKKYSTLQYGYLKQMGSVKLRPFLFLAMKEAMADELVDKFTWTGTGESKEFCNTKIAKTILSK